MLQGAASLGAGSQWATQAEPAAWRRALDRPASCTGLRGNCRAGAQVSSDLAVHTATRRRNACGRRHWNTLHSLAVPTPRGCSGVVQSHVRCFQRSERTEPRRGKANACTLTNVSHCRPCPPLLSPEAPTANPARPHAHTCSHMQTSNPAPQAQHHNACAAHVLVAEAGRGRRVAGADGMCCAMLAPVCRAHGRVARQLPPITPCTTPDRLQETLTPSVAGRTCGSALADHSGSLTVKLSAAVGNAGSGSPLWKLLPQQTAAELGSEASQRRLELADESLRCMHDDKAVEAGGAAKAQGLLPQLGKDVDDLLQHDAGLRMALALQGQSGAAGVLPVPASVRHGGLQMHRSRALARSQRSESAMAAWKG